jgi:hypothetical protein
MPALTKTKIGRVYKIVGIVEETKTMLYIGSTCRELEDRYKSHCSNDSGIMHKMINEFGMDSFEIKLIKEYNFIDKHQLLALEQLYINRYKNRIINLKDAVRFHKKEKRKEDEKRYRDTEKNKEYFKNYHKKNKEKIKERESRIVTCDNCGCKLRYNGMSRHKRTIKCQKFVNSVPLVCL